MALAVEGALRGESWLWGSPTYKQFLQAWDEFLFACGNVAEFKKGDQEIIFPTGGKIYMRSLNIPDNARGLTAYGVIFDECGDIEEDAWYQVVRPMLMDTGGPFWGLGTPRGRNWFWREWAAAGDREDSMAWQIPTLGCQISPDGKLLRKAHSYENTDIPWSEIENMHQRMPQDYFKQEILAEFVKFGGSVFRNIRPNLSELKIPASPEEHTGHLLAMCIDWGKHNDYTVIDIGCCDCKKELEQERFNQIDYTFQLERVKRLYDKWKPELVIAELNAMGEPNYERMWEDGIPVTGWWMTHTSKPGLIRGLATALERGEWQWLDIPEATFELEAYEQKVNRQTGRSTYSAPKGLHDDTVITRALLVHAEANMGRVPILVT